MVKNKGFRSKPLTLSMAWPALWSALNQVAVETALHCWCMENLFRPALPLVWRPVSLSVRGAALTHVFIWDWGGPVTKLGSMTRSRHPSDRQPSHLCCRCSAVRSPRYITSRRAGLAGSGPWQHFCCNCAALSHPLQHLVISEPMSPNNFSVQLWPLMFSPWCTACVN
jgi:hypothetical protein